MRYAVGWGRRQGARRKRPMAGRRVRKKGAPLLSGTPREGCIDGKGLRLFFPRYRSSRMAAPVQAMTEPMMELVAGIRRSMMPVMMSRAMG